MPAAPAAPAAPAKRVVIATNNPHKLAEIARILAPLDWEFVSLADCGDFPEPVEDADTFEGNARIKALAARANTGLAALADDSGLEVDALDGAPGVYSSRFAGEDGDDEANNDKLLALLADVDDEARTARFVSTIVFVDADGTEIVSRGTCEGSIARERRGEGGFGYDPLFESDDLSGMTTAEATPGEKDSISHRGRALRAFAREAASRFEC